MLRAELIERGFDAAGYITVRDAIDSLLWRRPGAIVIDLRGQPLPTVERLLDLKVPVIIVGGTPEAEDRSDQEAGAGAGGHAPRHVPGRCVR